MCVLKAKPLFLLLLAFLYDAVLYWYIYTRLPDGARRADILGLCSSLLTTVIMTLPAFEVVSMSPICFYLASSTVLCMKMRYVSENAVSLSLSQKVLDRLA